MSRIITAVYKYKNGILIPLGTWSPRENETVRIKILYEDPEDSEEKQAMQFEEGLITPPPKSNNVRSVRKRILQKQARERGMKHGKPLSEIIIEERGE